MRKTAILCALAACALAFAAADGAASEPATLVVDRDGVQCGNAGYASIQAAVDAAQPGDLIRVCPDLYTETVVVDKPLTLKADPDAVEAIDCFQPTLGELPTDQQAIVDPAGEGFSIAFKLEADDVELAGFVVQGASVGIDASDRFSGYRIHHNLVLLNTLFGIDFGSAGTRESRVDHTCIRENPYGLVSELDDDSLWKESDGPERDPWNARDLRNARIDQNAAFRNEVGGLEAAGPGQRDQVAFEHNTVREGIVGIAIQNSTESVIAANDIALSQFASILLGGANGGLEIDSNTMRGGGSGVVFGAANFIDRFPVPSEDVVVSQNDVAGGAAGILTGAGNIRSSDLLENTTSGNRGNGIVLLSGNTGNIVRGNQSDNNGVNGIVALLGATGNRFEQNSMHGNANFDARDLNTPLNVWINNDCEKDSPAGMLCGVG
jgi:Periplasmic copper-binding protein (NosD)